MWRKVGRSHSSKQCPEGFPLKFCFVFETLRNFNLCKDPLVAYRFCIRYFSKTKHKPAKKITGQCCSTEMEFACENSANLEQETKTTKIVTYPLFPLASSTVEIGFHFV